MLSDNAAAAAVEWQTKGYVTLLGLGSVSLEAEARSLSIKADWQGCFRETHFQTERPKASVYHRPWLVKTSYRLLLRCPLVWHCGILKVLRMSLKVLKIPLGHGQRFLQYNGLFIFKWVSRSQRCCIFLTGCTAIGFSNFSTSRPPKQH